MVCLLKFLKEEAGATAVEYAVMLALILLACVGAIKVLGELADSDNRIKLFDMETSQTTGGNFQIGSAEAAGEIVSMALGAFNFTYRDKKRNILFVSWGLNELDYWLSAQKMSLSPTIYADVRDIVKSRLADSRKTLIMDIEI